MEFWQTRGGIEFQYKLLHQLTRIADGIETQNSLYERLLPSDEDVPQVYGRTDEEWQDPDPADSVYYGQKVAPVCPEPDLTNNCKNCEKERCQPFIAKAVWLHDDSGNDVMQYCRCTCTCHMKEEEVTV